MKLVIIYKLFDYINRNYLLPLWQLSLTKKASILIIINGLLQLWLSKYHINAITLVFTTYIGVWLFAFIIFGLVAVFSATRIHKLFNKIITIIFSLSSAGFGIIFVLIANLDKVPYHEIQKSMNYAYFGIATYLLAAILLIVSIFLEDNRN